MTNASSHSAVWHPFTQHALAPEAIKVARGDGAFLETSDGKKIFDAICSWWVITHGHRHPRIVEAIRAQADQLDQVIFAGFTHDPAETVARKLTNLTPDGLSHVFFSDSGSTAVEVAMKMALGFFKNRGQQRTRFVAMEHAYHGDTVAAMSIGERGVFNEAYEPLLFDVARIPFPKPGQEQKTIDALDKICQTSPVAALIIEPLLLGAGGMLTYPAWVIDELKQVLERHGALLIADEILTGWGRTGSRFAIDQTNTKPDIMCLAKGLTGGSMPLAVTLATNEIFDAHHSTDRRKTFYHSSSFTANPIACAAAVANLQVWEDEPVAERIDTITSLHTKHLDQLSAHPSLHNARQCGTIAAIDIKVDDVGYLAQVGPKIMTACIDHGVLIRPLGNTIYVMPPYCSTDADLKHVYDVILQAVDEIVKPA